MNTPLLKMNQLGYEAEGKVILKGIDFSVEEGEFVTITDPSGSGKSTLLKIIASMLS